MLLEHKLCNAYFGKIMNTSSGSIVQHLVTMRPVGQKGPLLAPVGSPTRAQYGI